MNIDLQISPTESTKHEFAQVDLRCNELGLVSTLDVEYTPLYKRCRLPAPLVLDFLFFSSVIYAIDQMVPRSKADDKWTRRLTVDIPVSEVDRWQAAASILQDALSFLTGDRWELSFSPRTASLRRLRKRERRVRSRRVRGDAVCLFSGGLDSLIGAIDWLESHEGQRLLLVGHHDFPGPESDQNRLWPELLERYGRERVDILQIRVGQAPKGKEISLRSRSLVFVALGVYAASSLGDDIPVLVPENGNIALNVPLTPSRRGACSTRTTHPYFLTRLSEALGVLGLQHHLVNDLASKTKGECAQQCLNQDLFRRVALKSVSCAKRGHTREWERRSANGCGYCMPCIFRRAALHAVGLDTEDYGLDLCRGEINPRSDGELPNDLRAVLAFLRRKPTRREIEGLLVVNGRLDLERLVEYSNLVDRAMGEVRELIRAKAVDDIRQFAGIRT